MKAFILGLLVSTSALAQWFPGQYFPGHTQVSVFPRQITAQVFNPHPRPIVCHGTVFGRDLNGMVINAFFAERIILPGGFQYAYVHSAPYSIFVHGWANANCRWGW